MEQHTDALLDELWGLLCPDMGPEEWRDAVKTLAKECVVDVRAGGGTGTGPG